MPSMLRLTRGNAKTCFSISIVLNMIALIILFLPTERTRRLLGDEAWDNLAKFGIARSLKDQAFSNVPARGCSMCEVDPVLCEEIG